MALSRNLTLLLVLLCILPIECQEKITDENLARAWLDQYNEAAQIVYAETTQASWEYNTNITDYNQEKSNNASVRRSMFDQEASRNASLFDWQNFRDEDMKRQFSKLSIANTAKLPGNKVRRVSELRSNLQKIYSTGKVCNRPKDTSGRCYPLNPDLTRIMATSRDFDELTWAWKSWRAATGKKMKDQYEEYVGLQNEAAVIEGFNDQGDYWRSWYETDNFEQLVANLWEDVKPLYQQLHAYVRRKLMETYRGKDFPKSGHIPAQLLGNMWAQTWESLEPIVRPYKNKTAIDVTKALVDQGYNATRMFLLSEEFFTSLGLEPMPDLFWEKSMIEKPADGREVVCHASAWDFYNGKDFRIKQCTDITMDYLVTTHHEMGHVQYYLQYKHQPVKYRRGANPGFHEAIGDVMSLSVSTPSHLHSIGLLDKVTKDDEGDINFLMSQALHKVAFLPFGYLIDQWRWSVFNESTTSEHYNSAWWDLRCKLQGVYPPVTRSDMEHFDPGAKYHIPSNTPYIRYFVSFILQFQLHKSLCETAGHTGPLYQCDIYQSKEAGTKLKNLLRLGSSVKWPEVLEKVTGTRQLSSKPMFEYFEKLYGWLKEENKGHDVGWEMNCPPHSNLKGSEKITDEGAAKKWLQKTDKQMVEQVAISTRATWNFYTNLSRENRERQNEQSLQLSTFKLEISREADLYNWRKFSDPALKRQFHYYAIANTAKLSEEKIKRRIAIRNNLITIYNTEKVCERPGHAKNECFPLAPDLARIMATSRDPVELQWAWKGWRQVTGPKMKEIYRENIAIQNEAASIEGFKDQGEYWRSPYESEEFEKTVGHLFDEVKPLYQQLHTYVRRKLEEVYPNETFPDTKHIPAHLLGNMWAQTWVHLANILRPYKNATEVDITDALVEQGYNATGLAILADEFFQSLGLDPMPESFWKLSMLEKPKDGRPVVCPASAWNMNNGTDFRIKQCTDITGEWLQITHQVMGYIQYYNEYRHQSNAFRNGANPGFNEAIGELIGLSATSPSYLKSVGLLQKIENNYEADINYLMTQALVMVAFLPFGYLIDQWRWSVFRNEVPMDYYNSAWWDLRCKLQGVSPPVNRSDAEHFDPGAKYHIPADLPYIRYFVSIILQFQFHKSLCKAANFKGPLHKCSIHGSKEAGAKLRKLLQLGSSEKWPIALEQLAGTQEMSAKPMFEYFEELHDWLKRENEGHDVGWDEECPKGTNQRGMKPPTPGAKPPNAASSINSLRAKPWPFPFCALFMVILAILNQGRII